MGDLVEAMLQDSFDALRRGDRVKLAGIGPGDDAVDRLHEAIKMFVTDVTREPLSPGERSPKLQITVLVVVTGGVVKVSVK